MRANEFINESDFGVEPRRARRAGSRHPRGHEPKSSYNVVSQDDEFHDQDQELDERGKASVKLCTSSKPNARLGASQLSSCKSQGLRAREGKKKHTIKGRRQKVAGKKIKGAEYGGPIKNYDE